MLGALDDVGDDNETSNGTSTKNGELNDKHRHSLKYRELFCSRQVETLPATHIRGKCSVTLLADAESPMSYLSKEVIILFSCSGVIKPWLARRCKQPAICFAAESSLFFYFRELIS